MSTAAPAAATRPPTGSGQPLLSLTGVTKSFGAVKALTDIDLQVDAGEVVAIVGDNGAGKSTLVKTLAGVHAPDSGTFLFDGRPVTLADPSAAIELGIATVFQDLALCENLTVVDNLFLGRELSPFAHGRDSHGGQRQLGIAALVVGQDPDGADPDRFAVRRATPDGGDRPVPAGRSAHHHARRADRRTGCRPDR